MTSFNWPPSGGSSTPPEPTPNAYSVVGREIHQNGQRVQMYGTNVIGMELNDSVIQGLWIGQTIDTFIQKIKAQRFNCIRFPIGPQCLDAVAVDGGLIATWYPDNEYMLGWNSLQVLDELIRICEVHGMRYIFDIHYLNPDGSIPDLWYTDLYPESMWIDNMQFLATRYKGNLGFVGIDLKNEPNGNTCTWGSGDLATDWRLACNRAYLAINAVNPDILIMVEPRGLVPGIQEIIDMPTIIPASKLILSPHIYGPDVWWPFGAGFMDPSFPDNMPAIWDGYFGNVAQNHYVWIGEWGGQYGLGRADDVPWADAFVAYLVDRGITDFSYWGWGVTSDTSGHMGILANDDWTTVRTDKIENMDPLWTEFATFASAGGGGDVTVDGLSVLGNPTTSPAPGESITAENDFQVLRRNGSTLEFGAAEMVTETPFGSMGKFYSFEEELTLSGSSVTSSIFFPPGVLYFNVSCRVTETITGSGNRFRVGWSSQHDKFANMAQYFSGETTRGTANGPQILDYNNTPIVITSQLNDGSEGGSFSGGKVRVAIHYMTFTPPAS